MKARHDELAAELSRLRDAHTAEQADVQRLEGVSLTHMLASIRGSRDEQLARERAEAASARYRLAQAQSRLDALLADQETARRRLERLAGAPGRLAAALDAKEHYLRQSGDPRGGDLLRLAQERGGLTGELRETTEALQAAQAALDALAQVTDRLGSAENWSTYDTWFGGGAIASSVKHSRLDEAADAAAVADRRLAVLRTELADVGDPGLTARSSRSAAGRGSPTSGSTTSSPIWPSVSGSGRRSRTSPDRCRLCASSGPGCWPGKNAPSSGWLRSRPSASAC